MKVLLLKFLKISLLLIVCILLFGVTNHTVRTLVRVTLFPPSVVEIGNDMIDDKLFDINGNKKHLSDYLSDKYLLLNFCSNGCGVCEMSLPEIKEVAEIYRENLTLISINLDSKTAWKKAMAELNIPGINLHDPKSHAGLAGKYGNDLTVPYYVIISPEGKIVDKFRGFQNVREKVSANVTHGSVLQDKIKKIKK